MRKNGGVFGGTAGLWLVRKKHHATKLATTGQRVSDLGVETTTSGSVSSSTATGQTGYKYCATKNLESSNETKSWIGWDEVRCRPVYNATATCVKEEDADDDQDADTNNKTPLYASIKKLTHRVSTDTPEETSPAIPNTITKLQGRQRPRPKGAVYGGRRKRAFVPVTESRDSLSVDGDCGMESPPNKRICASNPNNQADKEKSSTTKENAAGKPSESKHFQTTATNTTNQQWEDSIFDFNQRDETKATAATAAEAANNNDRARRCHQPGHRTSLDVARAFFAKIDADPTLLTLEPHDNDDDNNNNNSQSPTPPVVRPVYTTRGRLPRKVALSEYQIYCAVCREATVSPLPMPAFLQQRSQFFRPGEVFDGMFDD